MDILSQTSDSLSLDLVKSHLYVDFIEDDDLIQHYIDASLQQVTVYLNYEVLETQYITTTEEFTPVNIDGVDVYKLKVPYKPNKITYRITNPFVPEGYTDSYESTDINYDVGTSTLIVPYLDKGEESVIVYAGKEENKTPAINQARMLLIGNWYAFREDNINTTINKLPTGAAYILDTMEGSIW